MFDRVIKKNVDIVAKDLKAHRIPDNEKWILRIINWWISTSLWHDVFVNVLRIIHPSEWRHKAMYERDETIPKINKSETVFLILGSVL